MMHSSAKYRKHGTNRCTSCTHTPTHTAGARVALRWADTCVRLEATAQADTGRPRRLADEEPPVSEWGVAVLIIDVSGRCTGGTPLLQHGMPGALVAQHRRSKVLGALVARHSSR